MASNDEEDVTPVIARVYTSFFKRDPQLYALGDIRFDKPKSLKTVGYTLVLIFIWAIPIASLIGLDKVIASPFVALIVLGPPIGLGMVMGKPLFHNKPLTKDLMSIFKYQTESRMYTDLIGYDYDDVDSIELGGSVWVADVDCHDGDDDHASKKRGHGKKTVSTGK